MKYVISDIHGEYDLFLKLLNNIEFNNNDKMIICGDIIDKGPYSIKLLKYIRAQSNMCFIIGNHEYDFLKFYNSIMQKLEDNFNMNEVLEKINSYFDDEEAMTWDDLGWLEEQQYYHEEEDFICVHAGVMLNNNNELISLEENDINWLVYDRRFKDPNLVINNSKCVFYGHTPTSYFINDYRIIAYKRSNVNEPKTIRDYYKIHLDCGTYLGGVLGCFRIDDCKEFYVKK